MPPNEPRPPQPDSTFVRVLTGRGAVTGIALGGAYGIVMRATGQAKNFDAIGGVMSLAFLFVVPIVIGYLTVRPLERPSKLVAVFAPWVSSTLVVLFAFLVGWEGAICIVLGLPLLLVLSSVGGLIAASSIARGRAMAPLLAALPIAVGPVERRFEPPRRVTETVSEVTIAAPPSRVWPLVASVDSIRREEQQPALFTRLGFPRPISATLSRPGVGGVRTARFEGGLVFTETVTDWAPGRRLAFSIRANTDSIPPTTLDPHVTIGGPYFDVLEGIYELTPTPSGGTHLVLRSRHRVSTRFNPYSGWWANRIMLSIQRNILAVHKARAEKLVVAGR